MCFTNMRTAINNSLIKELEENLSSTRGFMEETFSSQLEEMKTQLKELMQQRQEIGNLHRKLESWQDIAIEFFQSMERMLELDDNDQSSKQVIFKMVKDFEKFVNSLGLERISPSPGEDLDDQFHEFDQETESENVEVGKILKCKEWGYKINGEVYKRRRAKVILAKAPKEHKTLETVFENPQSESEASEPMSEPKPDDEPSRPDSLQEPRTPGQPD